jgi:hypothetical protein
MTIRDLWEHYRRNAILPEETPHEIALQKIGFGGAVIYVMGHLIQGKTIERGDFDKFMEEAYDDLSYDDLSM